MPQKRSLFFADSASGSSFWPGGWSCRSGALFHPEKVPVLTLSGVAFAAVAYKNSGYLIWPGGDGSRNAFDFSEDSVGSHGGHLPRLELTITSLDFWAFPLILVTVQVYLIESWMIKVENGVIWSILVTICIHVSGAFTMEPWVVSLKTLELKVVASSGG